MNSNKKLTKLVLGAALSTAALAAHSATPLWTFTPNTSPIVSITPNGIATVNYTVTNNSNKPHTLVLAPQAGLEQSSSCVLVGKGATCSLTITIKGSNLSENGISNGPVMCQINFNQCSQPDKVNSLVVKVVQGAILNISPANLALSVKDTQINPALSGIPRQITVTNEGDAPANELAIQYPAWPTGTTVDINSPSACMEGSTLEVGASCPITINPGATATSGTNNFPCTTAISPVPGVISVSASHTGSVAANVVVLGYGCIYQGGFVYSINDTTATTASIGGKVVALTDQVGFDPGIIWSSDDSGNYDDGVSIFGIAENSNTSFPNPNTGQISGQKACDGKVDGACNSNNITIYYSAVPANSYAAGRCLGTINSYNDWYLPAICEIGPDSNSSGCSTTTQNMIESLPMLRNSCSGAHCLIGTYWSSTEHSFDPMDIAWTQYISGSNMQTSELKFIQSGVRCSRALTR